MKNDHKGFSLIEIIIAMAIMAIITTGTLTIYSQVSFGNTTKAAKIIASTMDKLKIETLSKEQKQYLYLYKISDTIYMKVSPETNIIAAGLTAGSGTKIAENITVYSKLTSPALPATPTTPKELENASSPICISFERSTGAFQSDYEYIELWSSNRNAIIECIKETGRHWVE